MNRTGRDFRKALGSIVSVKVLGDLPALMAHADLNLLKCARSKKERMTQASKSNAFMDIRQLHLPIGRMGLCTIQRP